MNTNTKNANTKTTTTATAPIYTWGIAYTATAKDGTPREFAAVRFEAGKSGYTTEADLYPNIPACHTRAAAIVRAVAVARTTGGKITDKVRAAYADALEAVREDERDRAKRAAERAAAALDIAKNALAKAAVDAAAVLAGIPA